MVMYRLLVTCDEPNGDYDAEMADYKAQEERRRYSGYMGGDFPAAPRRVVTRTVLDVMLNETEYHAVKRAAIEAAD